MAEASLPLFSLPIVPLALSFFPSLQAPQEKRKRELKQQRRRRLQKRHLKKSEFALPQPSNRAYSISFPSSNVGKFFWSWILSTASKFRKRKRKFCCTVFPSSTKREIRHFHDVVVQRPQRNVQKSVMRVQSCCFAYLILLLFCRSRCRRRRRRRCLIAP